MISKEAYVWIWLPGHLEPVICGRIEEENGFYYFNYGKSYLNLNQYSGNPCPIYLPELPLKEGRLPLSAGLKMPNSIRDSSPDAWGRRVIINALLGQKGKDMDTNQLSELDYLLYSGSDRIGNLDFQTSPKEYVPRQSENPKLEELLASAEKVEKGLPLSKELDQALFHGSSIGGARPKALIQTDNKKYIAKFSSGSDLYNVVKSEFIAMKLAKLCGINVADVKLVSVTGRDILLIERFDRIYSKSGWNRKALVSALTLLELDEMMARYASYQDLCEIIRHRFQNPMESLMELFKRLVFNVLCGNTDDHARNHAAFWDGSNLTLTPAYDICPQPRAGGEASQGMLIVGENRQSNLSTCLAACKNFHLSVKNAKEIISSIQATIETHWSQVCDEAELSSIDRQFLRGRQFMNPFSMDLD